MTVGRHVRVKQRAFRKTAAATHQVHALSEVERPAGQDVDLSVIAT